MVEKDGTQVGVLTKEEAIQRAKQKNLDVVVVAPNAKPPVAKIIDFANFKYQQKKKNQSGKKKSKGVELKEIRLTPFIAANDLSTRVKKAQEFLEDGDRVKVNVKFVGRQITRKEFGYEVLDKVTEQLGETAVVDQPAKMQGKILTLTLKPGKKTKKQDQQPKTD